MVYDQQPGLGDVAWNAAGHDEVWLGSPSVGMYRRVVEEQEARRRFAASPVARLATVRPDGTPHVVPVTFAVEGEVLYTAVDRKPKRHQRLQRLANLRHEPRCALLVDHYQPDWSGLWWARADGEAVVVDEPESIHPGLALLTERYPEYRDVAPEGPLIIVTVVRWTGWAASM